MNGIKEWLKRLFFGGPKVDIYERPVSPDIKKLHEQVLKDNAILRAENLRHRSMIDKKKLDRERMGKEEREKEYVLEQMRLKKTQEKENELMLPLFGLKESPTFFMKDNVPIGKFKGFGMKQTDDGRTLWYPVLTRDGKTNFIPTGNGTYASNPMDIFKGMLGIVTQMRNGKVDSNYGYVFGRGGEKEMRLFKPKYRDKKGKEVDIVRMDEIERYEFERKLEELGMELKLAYSKMESLKEREIGYEARLAASEVDTKSAEKGRDIYASQMAAIASEKAVSDTKAATYEAGAQQLKTQQVMTESLNSELVAIIDRMRDLIRKHVPEKEFEPTEARLKEVLASITAEKKEPPPALPEKPSPPPIKGR